jgi:hypothetical protein
MQVNPCDVGSESPSSEHVWIFFLSTMQRYSGYEYGVRSTHVNLREGGANPGLVSCRYVIFVYGVPNKLVVCTSHTPFLLRSTIHSMARNCMQVDPLVEDWNRSHSLSSLVQRDDEQWNH